MPSSNNGPSPTGTSGACGKQSLLVNVWLIEPPLSCCDWRMALRYRTTRCENRFHECRIGCCLDQLPLPGARPTGENEQLTLCLTRHLLPTRRRAAHGRLCFNRPPIPFFCSTLADGYDM